MLKIKYNIEFKSIFMLKNFIKSSNEENMTILKNYNKKN